MAAHKGPIDGGKAMRVDLASGAGDRSVSWGAVNRHVSGVHGGVSITSSKGVVVVDALSEARSDARRIDVLSLPPLKIDTVSSVRTYVHNADAELILAGLPSWTRAAIRR